MSGGPSTRFPGATAVSDLRVYDSPGPDGLRGGAPHLHTVSTEGYVVLEGSGELRAITSSGPSHHPLRSGTVLWFSPGTVHRLVDHGDLRILTVMQNAGLPEAGDAVLTFPRAVLADPDAYRAAAVLPATDDQAALAAAARRRRDLAVEGSLELLDAVARDGAAALADVHVLAGRLVAPLVADWRRRWSDTVEQDVLATRGQLDALDRGRVDHLGDAEVVVGVPRPGPALHGMCGRLGVWDAPAADRADAAHL